MKEIFKFLGTFLSVVVINIVNIMLIAWGLWIAYRAVQGAVCVPDITYPTWIAVSTACETLIKFWPFHFGKQTNDSEYNLMSIQGASKLIGIYLTKLAIITAAGVSLGIAALIN